MELRRELLLSVGVLAALNVFLALAAIGLFGRMVPAIERIIVENVSSMNAAEEMLAVLGEARTASLAAARRDRFDVALAAARQATTLPEEGAILDKIDRTKKLLFSGDVSQRQVLVEQVRALMSTNRAAVHRADLEARRLGSAGAWTSVFIAALTFLLSLIAVRRVQRRVLDPLAELHLVLEASRGGDRYRRCRPLEAPLELRRAMSSVNLLLDAVHELPQAPKFGSSIRAALLQLLDDVSDPSWVVDARGVVVASNRAGEEVLSGADGDRIRAVFAGKPDGSLELERRSLGEDGALYRLKQALFVEPLDVESAQSG